MYLPLLERDCLWKKLLNKIEISGGKKNTSAGVSELKINVASSQEVQAGLRDVRKSVLAQFSTWTFYA